MRGKFITIEGCDGSGKTTQSALLLKKIQELNIPCFLTREPGGTLISEKIRNLILDKENKSMIWQTEALLYAASRSQLVGEKISPALKKGINVICDRYIDSTLAYQGYGRGLSLKKLKELNFFATSGLIPDLTILLDIVPEESIKRRKGREADRLEKEKLDFHKRVREGYLKLAEMEPDRFKIIEVNKSIEEVHKEIINIVLPVIRG